MSLFLPTPRQGEVAARHGSGSRKLTTEGCKLRTASLWRIGFRVCGACDHWPDFASSEDRDREGRILRDGAIR